MKTLLRSIFTWANIYKIIAIALVFGFLIIYTKQNIIIDETAKLRSEMEVMHSFLYTPILKDIELRKISGEKVKMIPFSISVSEELDYIWNRHKNARPNIHLEGYMLKPSKPLKFHPKQWAGKVLDICSYAQKNGSIEDFRIILQDLVKQFQSYVTEIDSAIYVGYPFEYKIYDRILKPNWYSAIAQGYVLSALVKLYETTHDSTFMEMARKVHRSFLKIRNKAGQKNPWISFIDENHYLWFEEYPSERNPQLRVLNGHIYALMGLYSYYRFDSSVETLLLMRSGMTTVQRYFGEYRRPGKINRYCLLKNSKPDYQPSRSIMQQRWLFSVTKSPLFKEQFSAFQTDMGF